MKINLNSASQEMPRQNIQTRSGEMRTVSFTGHCNIEWNQVVTPGVNDANFFIGHLRRAKMLVFIPGELCHTGH